LAGLLLNPLMISTAGEIVKPTDRADPSLGAVFAALVALSTA
jgi:hypothetical protein